MIKKHTQKIEMNTVDGKESMGNEKQEIMQEIIETLKKFLPHIITSDNQLDTKALHDFLSLANTSSPNQSYELSFAGKSLVQAIAESKVTKELHEEKEQSKLFDNTNNVVIRGDNIDALKILTQNYAGKVKMIYIDPPYNTKSEHFIYNDNLKKSELEMIREYGLGEEATHFLHNVYGTQSHSGWLSFMYPRMKLARDLLHDDGAIFVSIDEHEHANLKILCDEIFGEENCVTQFVWETTKGAQGIVRENKIVSNYEFILCYAKQRKNFSFNGLERSESDGFHNPDNDKKGPWKRQYLQRFGHNFKKRKIINPENNMAFEFETPYTLEKIQKWIQNKEIIFPSEKHKYPARKEYLSEYKNKKQLANSLGLYSTKAATEKLQSLFDNKKIFNNPKPEELIKFLINQSTTPGDLILDFFAGSGTTADAVMQLNAEDGGGRSYMLVQWDEEINKKTHNEAYTFCTQNNYEPIISSITTERLNRVGKKIKRELQEQISALEEKLSQDKAREDEHYLKDKKEVKKLQDHLDRLDIGYKVFSLIDSTAKASS